MNNKTVEINNFIGVYDNYITPEECNKVIKVYEDETKLQKTLDRMASENASVLQKKDKQYFAAGHNLDVWWEDFKTLMFNVDIAFKNYCTNTGAHEAYDNIPFNYTGVKIQKTLPTEGYHTWHLEHNKGYHNEARAFVFSVYLNDVKEGGETEFLHFSQRVKPKTGRIVIWPSAFPYLHRGNPPLSGEKYILTSWVMLR